LENAARTKLGWADSALTLTAGVGVAAKIAGVIVAPGARGVLGGSAVNLVDATSGTLAYTLTALLVALVCAASFELARARPVNVLARSSVVAVAGLVIALASPAVVERLSTLPSLALAVITSLIALIAGGSALRVPETRALGGVVTLLALSGFLRVVAWETAAVSFDRASLPLHELARVFTTAAVCLQAFASLLAAAWIGTRSTSVEPRGRTEAGGRRAITRWQGRILANLAIIVAFGLTWLAARRSESPSAIEAILRTALSGASKLPPPFMLGSIAAFLLPASILLAGAALLVPSQPRPLVGALAFALLSQGAFDVPLQALLITASAQWAMLAMADRASWSTAAPSRDDDDLPQTTVRTTKSA